jgi:hypothetical protein
MIRMLIVGYVFVIRSERALAYRWFRGLGIEPFALNDPVLALVDFGRRRDHRCASHRRVVRALFSRPGRGLGPRRDSLIIGHHFSASRNLERRQNVIDGPTDCRNRRKCSGAVPLEIVNEGLAVLNIRNNEAFNQVFGVNNSNVRIW